MMPLHQRSIRRKLNLVALLTCLTAVVLSGAALLVHEVLTFRGKLVSELSTQARILGRLTRAALSFEDRVEAERTLSELNQQKHIECAILYHQGTVFAEFHRSGSNHGVDPDHSHDPNEPMADAEQYTASTVTVVRRIELDGTPIGTVVIRADLSDLRAYAVRHSVILAGVFGVSTLVALLMATRFHRSILRPIQELTRTARTIAQDQDFTQRAQVVSDDETGELTQAFNRMLDRIDDQATALRQSEARYRILFRSSPLPTWLFDAESFRFLEVNQAALETYRFTEEEFLSLSVPDVCTQSASLLQNAIPAPAPTDDAFQPIRGCLRRHRRKDGTLIDVEVCADPIQYRDRRAWLVVAQDVTTRKQAEADLAAANEKLIETSRQAGMAEVATGVLHNVGNVLNSVNVSATLIRDRLGASKLNSLRRTTDLLKPHLESLGEFVTRDPQGRLVAPFLIQLTDHLLEEQNRLIGEANSLTVNIEHIKEIVSMQQSFARVSGVREPLEPAALFEDALRMNIDSFEKRGILIERRFAPTSRVLADRHKVLQILLNLIGNARHALENGAQIPRKLTLLVGVASPTHAFLAVADNGMGIAPEALMRIFQLGFTTKRDGHGFGLHSGANAAREMGGSLGVSSDGPGLGASFRLELPFAPPDATPTAPPSSP
ncbi:MAG: HAMP domain-containing protein [Verrucomicrobiales bacterium]|nr:HAMP domain-containing protein [Verrucomicrobiales bacterium]